MIKNYYKKTNNRVFVIAEAGSNHLKNLKRAYRLIDIAKKAGADAVKFQSFQADEIATKNLRYNKIDNRFKKYGKNLYEFYKKFELPENFYEKIINYCNKKRIIFLTSVFGFDSYAKIKKYCNIIKIASFESNYFELINQLVNDKKYIIISTGCDNLKDINQLILFFKKKKYKNFSILHCGSDYPLDYKNVNLKFISRLKIKYPKINFGYSDHTLGISVPISAVTLGATIIEKHFTISKRDGSPDSFFSLEEKDLIKMIKNIRDTENFLGNENKYFNKKLNKMKKIGRRSYYANTALKKGAIIKKGMFKALRPSIKNGVDLREYFNFIGKKIKKNIKANEPLKNEHLY